MTDEEYMSIAIEEAKRGAGWVAPNPMVGAVIVKDGQIIGKGYHTRYGDLHAEREAIAASCGDLHGSTIYVTLEPCCHYGKQPPCIDAITDAGISRVVFGSSDPNPLVNGKGVSILREKGITVVSGVLKNECDKINKAFFRHIQTGLPYVTLKYAMTMDGKIASHTGLSKWITGETARRHVHQERSASQAIMVGIGTVLSDDPLLTSRIEGGRNPIRIICDTNLRTPLDSNIVKTAKDVRTIIACSVSDESRYVSYTEKGCEVIFVEAEDGHIDLKKLMSVLGTRQINSILLEGGSQLNWAAVKAGIVNRVQAYIAPKILGGSDAKTPVGGIGMDDPENCLKLVNPEITRLGDDILIESEVE
jgi:diaminohydroxyphosphoribosylaminopyrimidine deaminase/5-amino-6-(5-phosphoribosylamino)uracil reductase